MEDDFKPFSPEDDEKAFKALAARHHLTGHAITGSTYIARLADGRQVSLSLDITMRDMDAVKDDDTASNLDLLEKLATRAHTKTSLKDLPMQTVAEITKDYSDVLNRMYGAGLGKSSD